jgi:hypothetical protein
MPCAEASIVATASIAPSRAIRTDDGKFVWIPRERDAGPEVCGEGANELRDTLAIGCALHARPAATGVGDHIRCKETFRCGEIALPGRNDKRFGKPSLLG